MRVLHLISSAGPHPYFEHFGAHTDRDRFDLRLASLGPAGALQEDGQRMGFRVLSFGASSRMQYPRTCVAVARYLRRERIDVIQAHLLDACVVGLAAARLARTPVKIFTAHHSHEVPLHSRQGLSVVDRLAAGRLADAVIAPSEQMKQTLVSHHRLPAGRVHVIHHGFDLEGLDPERVEGHAVSRELGLESKIVLTSIGRLYWIKNQENLVRAFAALDLPETVLLLAGEGDRAALTELVRSLGLGERVRLLGNRPDVPELLAATDLYLHPAKAESFAMVILEAMAMGTPVVSTPVGIAPLVVEDGVTGFLATDSDPTALGDALQRALEQRERWPELGKEARARANGFPAKRMVRDHEALYRGLARRTGMAPIDQGVASGLDRPYAGQS